LDEKAIHAEIATLSAKFLSLRDIVARLVAYEATRAPDPAARLNEFSESATAHIFDTEKRMGEVPDLFAMKMSAVIQEEVDWVVEAARRLAT